MSHYSGIFVGGPMAGGYSSSSEDRIKCGEVTYSHRILVTFKNGQNITAWVPLGTSNLMALEHVFKAYESGEASNA